MEYFNVLKSCDNSEKYHHILINISNINQKFTWHNCQISDKEINNCINNLFIETSLVIVKKLVMSLYNNQYYLEIDVSKNQDCDYQNFKYNLDFIYKLFNQKIKEYSCDYNIKNPLEFSFDNQLKIFIDMNIKPLLYFNDKQTFNFELNNNFKNIIENSKIKCIIKPLLWSCKKENKIMYGIKYVMYQCVISKIKNITDFNINQEKILNLRESSDNMCSVCHEYITNLDNNYENSITTLPCKHKFHFKCINNWYITQMSNNRHFTCPCCRRI